MANVKANPVEAPAAPVETDTERRARQDRELAERRAAEREKRFSDLPDALIVSVRRMDGTVVIEDTMERRAFASGRLGYWAGGKAPIPGTPHRVQASASFTVIKSGPTD